MPEFKKSSELFTQMSEDLEKIQEKMLAVIRDDVKKTVLEQSGGRLSPNSMTSENKSLVVIPYIMGDEDGAIAQKIEGETLAFNTAYKNVSNSNYVINLLDKELRI